MRCTIQSGALGYVVFQTRGFALIPRRAERSRRGCTPASPMREIGPFRAEFAAAHAANSPKRLGFHGSPRKTNRALDKNTPPLPFSLLRLALVRFQHPA